MGSWVVSMIHHCNCAFPTPALPPPPLLRRYGCEADPGAVSQYEARLFPPFQVVLSEDVQEFHPYVFQIFAQVGG